MSTSGTRRRAIQMTDDEVRDFLEETGRMLQVASVNPDGTPHLVPMYYAVVDGEVVFWTYGKSQKVVNLRRDPRLTVLVEAGFAYEELRGVSITGRARIVEDTEAKLDIGCAIHPRYFGDEATPEVREVLAIVGAKRVGIAVEPERVVSWDHRKLGGDLPTGRGGSSA